MTQDADSPWEAPEFLALVAERISEGQSGDAAWQLAAEEVYPTIWVPPGITRH